MLENTYQYKDALDCYLLNEQPMTCGICGARTDFDVRSDGTELHQCLNNACGYMFEAVDEDNF